MFLSASPIYLLARLLSILCKQSLQFYQKSLNICVMTAGCSWVSDGFSVVSASAKFIYFLTESGYWLWRRPSSFFNVCNRNPSHMINSRRELKIQQFCLFSQFLVEINGQIWWYFYLFRSKPASFVVQRVTINFKLQHTTFLPSKQSL